MYVLKDALTELGDCDRNDRWLFLNVGPNASDVDEVISQGNSMAETHGLTSGFFWSGDVLDALAAYTGWLKPKGYTFIYWVAGDAEFFGNIAKQSDVGRLFELSSKLGLDIRLDAP